MLGDRESLGRERHSHGLAATPVLSGRTTRPLVLAAEETGSGTGRGSLHHAKDYTAASPEAFVQEAVAPVGVRTEGWSGPALE